MALSYRIENAIEQHKLPNNFIDTVNTWYAPIARDISRLVEQQDSSLVLGVQGCQGSGKSTFASFLKVLLESEYNIATAVLSIDDFYLRKHERNALAASIHPLLATRGVPGTHDVQLALDTIEKLSALKDEQALAIPRFDKRIDDRADPQFWDQVSGEQQVIILEGWCVGIEPQDEARLEPPLNDLEKCEDADSSWRHYVNNCLGGPYQTLFQQLQKLVVLRAPSFDCVFRWRSLQEEKLIAKLAVETASSAPQKSGRTVQTMNAQQLLHFISHYQRLTEHALKTLPAKADWLLSINDDHTITACQKPSL